MDEFKFTVQKMPKIQGFDKITTNQNQPEKLELIVKVTEPNYIPSGLKVRSHIDDKMLTAEADVKYLEQLNNDDKITSIAISKILKCS